MQKLKSCAFLAILSLLLLAGCNDSETGRWEELGKADGWDFYIDRASVQKTSDTCATAWVRKGNPRDNDNYYWMYLLEFDFSYRTCRQLGDNFYGNISHNRMYGRVGVLDEYKLVSSDNTPTDWLYFEPDSILDSAYLKIKKWLRM